MASALNLTRGTSLAADLDLARSFWARFRGLMGRRGLPEGSGLWLPGSSSIHMLFMRFAIDCVFLGREEPDGSRAVVGLRRDLRPWTGVVWWAHGGAGTLELPVGSIDASGTQVGDRVIITR